MASVTYSAGIDHVSGALSKPGKSGQHSCEKMLLATHRTAATTSNKCNRLYLRTPVKRTSPLSQREFENRAKFMVVSGMIKARKADLMKITTDQQNFLAQKNDPDGAKTMKAYGLRGAYTPRSALRLFNYRGILYRHAKKIAEKFAYVQFFLYLCTLFVN